MSAEKVSLVERLTHLWDPHTLKAWAQSYRRRPGLRAFGIRQLEIFILTARSLLKEEITLRAAALTYHTILSIVPLLAVGFALFKAFGGLQKLEGPLRDMVVQNLAAGRANEVGEWLEKFIGNINAGAIAGVGVLILFYSAVGLLTNIESSINRIWGIHRGRPFFIRFAIYWCLITLAPPLLGVSVSFTARLQTSAFATTVVQWLPFGLGKLLISLSSALSVCIAFVLTYLIVPHTKVRFKAALLGGLVAGLLWSLIKYAYITLSASSMKYSAVYGALGALPLLMIWIYISWLIVLFGATYAFVNQAVHTESLDSPTFAVPTSQNESLSVRLVVLVAMAFRAGRPAPSADTLAEQAQVPTPLAERMLETLVAHNILAETQQDSEMGYLPARDLQELTPADILTVLRHQAGHPLVLEEDARMAEISRLLREAEAAEQTVLAQTNLRQLALNAEGVAKKK